MSTPVSPYSPSLKSNASMKRRTETSSTSSPYKFPRTVYENITTLQGSSQNPSFEATSHSPPSSPTKLPPVAFSVLNTPKKDSLNNPQNTNHPSPYTLSDFPRPLNYSNMEIDNSTFSSSSSSQPTAFSSRFMETRHDGDFDAHIFQPFSSAKSAKHPSYLFEGFQRKAPTQITREPQIVGSATLELNNETLNIKRISSGNAHVTYEFLDKKKVMISKTDRTILEVDLSTVVLKTFIPDINVQKVRKTKKKPSIFDIDKQGYEFLKNNHVPLAKVLIWEDEFIDTKNPKNGGFLLVEKMTYTISTAGWAKNNISFDSLGEEDKQVLLFAKHWLQKMVSSQTDMINDFYPRNVMLNKEKACCVIDFSLPQNDEWYQNVVGYYIAWADQNENILSFLMSDLLPAQQEGLKVAIKNRPSKA